MSKELTEQWRNGMLKEGWYYLSIVPSKKCIDYFVGQDFERYNEWAIEEVLAPIPTCEEWEELQESNDGLSKLMFKSLMNKFVKADEERERLEKENSELTTKCSQLEKKVKKRGMQINRAYDRYIAKRKENSEMVTKCNRLEEQLKEANGVIKFYANIDKLTKEEKQMTGEKYHLVYGLKANDYLEKWGGK